MRVSDRARQLSVEAGEADEADDEVEFHDANLGMSNEEAQGGSETHHTDKAEYTAMPIDKNLRKTGKGAKGSTRSVNTQCNRMEESTASATVQAQATAHEENQLLPAEVPLLLQQPKLYLQCDVAKRA